MYVHNKAQIDTQEVIYGYPMFGRLLIIHECTSISIEGSTVLYNDDIPALYQVVDWIH